MPAGAFICAKPPPPPRQRRSNGLLRQASSTARLTRAGGGHLVQHRFHVDGFQLHPLLGRQPGIDRNHVVAPADLDAMAGVEQHSHCALRQLLAEIADGRFHRAFGQVLARDDFEPEFPQPRRHAPRVVDRILQRPLPIGRVANHQCGTLLPLCPGCVPDEREHQGRDRKDAEPPHGITPWEVAIW
ncbi:MAG: hypothetical protein IT562_09415 [Alphaproteobacteria bacterium]|nr:hypothetical protein [Alphaproteobacteria bacterium]